MEKDRLLQSMIHPSRLNRELLAQFEHKEQVYSRWRVVGQTRRNEATLSGLVQMELGGSELT